eukprot:9418080-Alexandrium_andersonii.AAC.1
MGRDRHRGGTSPHRWRRLQRRRRRAHRLARRGHCAAATATTGSTALGRRRRPGESLGRGRHGSGRGRPPDR